MSYAGIENNPIIVDLLAASNDTGWSIAGDIATHSSCNSGSVRLNGYSLTIGDTYEISYAVLSISGGYVQLFAGTAGGVQRTTTGLFVETIVANGGVISFYSNANCSIQAFNIRNTVEDVSNVQRNTPIYSVDNKKWGEFRTIAPDFGFSIYIDLVTIKNGNLYLHQNGTDDRNNFYGVQYETIFQFVENANPTILKNYNSIAFQANELLVTGDDGIVTSLGQISELAEQDFIKGKLSDATSVTNIEAQYGVFSASFLKDKRFDLINGDALSGSYITINLQTTTGNLPLRLFSVAVNSSVKHIGNR